ncbi:MAG: hypothetical protein AAF203_09415, partial [Pseudomonadota bacterium]
KKSRQNIFPFGQPNNGFGLSWENGKEKRAKSGKKPISIAQTINKKIEKPNIEQMKKGIGRMEYKRVHPKKVILNGIGEKSERKIVLINESREHSFDVKIFNHRIVHKQLRIIKVRKIKIKTWIEENKTQKGQEKGC